MKLNYDKNGLGFAETTFLAFYHPILFFCLQQALKVKLAPLALKLVRYWL